ncbi:MAG: cytochrome c [Alphaproteobacteria bacterium]|nr:cytochrome c [Alphaproteobacteria bacterium]
MKFRATALALALAAGTTVIAASLGAFAQGKPADAIPYRKAIFQINKWQMGVLAGMSKGEIAFNAAAAAKATAALRDVSMLVGDAFPAGSGDGDTKAKPEVWEKAADFAKAVEMFQTAAKGAASTTIGSKDDIGKVLPALGAACKNCHDNFRKS